MNNEGEGQSGGPVRHPAYLGERGGEGVICIVTEAGTGAVRTTCPAQLSASANSCCWHNERVLKITAITQLTPAGLGQFSSYQSRFTTPLPRTLGSKDQ